MEMVPSHPSSNRTRPPWRASVLTLLPNSFPGLLGTSIIGRALENRLWSLDIHDIRQAATDKHRTVDDTPAGGGPGMVLRADVLSRALSSVTDENSETPLLVMSPRGRPFTQSMARALAAGPGVRLVCGRFEGIDQRFLDNSGAQEVSIGDYVLAGGEAAAMVMLEAIVRLLPGVLGSEDSAIDESFENGLLEHPHYTRPRIWEGHAIPDVLLSGNHAEIERWRHEKAKKLTVERRPDLIEAKTRADRT